MRRLNVVNDWSTTYYSCIDLHTETGEGLTGLQPSTLEAVYAMDTIDVPPNLLAGSVQRRLLAVLR